MLLDGGGLSTFGSPPAGAIDIGEEVVSAYLWSRSIRRLDVIAVSHAHTDHIGGLPALLENFPVRELWVGGNPLSPEYARVLEAARVRGVTIIPLKQGDVRAMGGVTFQVLWPPRDWTPGRAPSNNDSLVMTAAYGRRTFLLTGDIERGPERRLVEEGLVPRIDVLKAPHHGSKTSANEFFLDSARPWLAVVSAGFENPYGHPHPDVLARLAVRRMAIWRTDRDGLVTISTDGHRVTAWSYRLEKSGR
jgi:competence protein ComEC